MNAYNVAVRDWRRPPVIDSIELDDGLVRVSAYDDVMVTKVIVTVLDEAGQPLEQGEANLWMSVRWDYQTANRGTLCVEAWDLAGNVTRQEFCPPSRSFSVWKKASSG